MRLARNVTVNYIRWKVDWQRENDGREAVFLSYERIRARFETEKRQELQREKGQAAITV